MLWLLALCLLALGLPALGLLTLGLLALSRSAPRVRRRPDGFGKRWHGRRVSSRMFMRQAGGCHIRRVASRTACRGGTTPVCPSFRVVSTTRLHEQPGSGYPKTYANIH